MGTVQPKGEKIRQAVKWISSERLEDETRPFEKLVEEASTKFNLSPLEEDYLRSFYKESRT